MALLVTCLVDMFRPSVGFATVKLLEQAGCRVTVPEGQACCGQPAFNSGDSESAAAIAEQIIDTFSGFDYVVLPSGSCAGMIRKLPELTRRQLPHLEPAAEALAAKTHELTSFLVDVLGFAPEPVRWPGSVTYHDSCSGLRELGVKTQPRQLLSRVEGLELKELTDCEVCCGFGGTFCVKYPEISGKMVSDKVDNIRASGAGMLAAGDMGCLLNMAGRLRREGLDVEVRHVAEILAGMRDTPGIGDG